MFIRVFIRRFETRCSESDVDQNEDSVLCLFSAILIDPSQTDVIISTRITLSIVLHRIPMIQCHFFSSRSPPQIAPA